jgi:hypothetical protein
VQPRRDEAARRALRSCALRCPLRAAVASRYSTPVPRPPARRADRAEEWQWPGHSQLRGTAGSGAVTREHGRQRRLGHHHHTRLPASRSMEIAGKRGQSAVGMWESGGCLGGVGLPLPWCTVREPFGTSAQKACCYYYY